MIQWLNHSRLQATLSARLNLHLAEALGVTAERVMTLLSETPAQDREPVIAQAETRVPSARLARLLRWWVKHPQRSARDGIIALDRSLAELDPRPELRTLVSMAELCSAEERPWLALIPPAPLPDDPVTWLSEAGQRMQSVAKAMPDWPILIAAPEEVWRAAINPDIEISDEIRSLQGALLEPIDGPAAEPTGDVLQFYDLDTSLRSLLRGQGTDQDNAEAEAPPKVPPRPNPASDLKLESPSPAVVASPAPEDETPGPQAALLKRLEADPTTAGRFVADARLDGGPAGRKVEVALFAAELEVAIELDVDFAAPSLEVYRKSRAKDLWLQRHGILVMRVLAQDLEQRLEDVALQIRDVVRERRIRGRGRRTKS